MASVVVHTARLKPDIAEAAAVGSWAVATDLADALAREGMPFHQAHKLVGELVRTSLAEGRSARDWTPEQLCAFAPQFTPAMARLLDPREGLKTREIVGGTGPRHVAAALEQAKQRLAAM
jgi:argininosuccinate lyase